MQPVMWPSLSLSCWKRDFPACNSPCCRSSTACWVILIYQPLLSNSSTWRSWRSLANMFRWALTTLPVQIWSSITPTYFLSNLTCNLGHFHIYLVLSGLVDHGSVLLQCKHFNSNLNLPHQLLQMNQGLLHQDLLQKGLYVRLWYNWQCISFSTTGFSFILINRTWYNNINRIKLWVSAVEVGNFSHSTTWGQFAICMFTGHSL